jgi:hypothetical protein
MRLPATHGVELDDAEMRGLRPPLQANWTMHGLWPPMQAGEFVDARPSAAHGIELDDERPTAAYAGKLNYNIGYLQALKQAILLFLIAFIT